MTTAAGQVSSHTSAQRPLGERRDSSELSVWPFVAARSSGRIARYTGLCGDQRLAGFATVPEVGWKIWVSQDRAEVEADLIATYRRLLGWTLLALAGARWRWPSLVATQVSRPISALRNTASAIAAGDATRKVPPGGPHEVAGLAQAFDGMLGRLTQAAQAALESGSAETAALLAIAQVIGGTLDLSEALRTDLPGAGPPDGRGNRGRAPGRRRANSARSGRGLPRAEAPARAVATTPGPARRAGLPRDRFRGGSHRLERRCHARPPLRVPALPAFPHQSGLIIPLVLDSQVAGTLYLVWWRSAAASTRPSSPSCSAVGQQAGTLLRSAQLHAATERQARQATKLYEVAGQLASSLDLDLVLDRVAQTTLDLLDCDASGIYAYDEARGGLVLRRGLHLDPDLGRDLVLQPGEGVAGRAFVERRPVWTRDRETDAALEYTPAPLLSCGPRRRGPSSPSRRERRRRSTACSICHYLAAALLHAGRGRSLLDPRRPHRHRPRASSALPRVRIPPPGPRRARGRHPAHHPRAGPARGAPGHRRGRRGAVPRRRPASGSSRGSSSSGRP